MRLEHENLNRASFIDVPEAPMKTSSPSVPSAWQKCLEKCTPWIWSWERVEGVEILQCIDAVNEVTHDECEEERGAWDGSQDPYYLKG